MSEAGIVASVQPLGPHAPAGLEAEFTRRFLPRVAGQTPFASSDNDGLAQPKLRSTCGPWRLPAHCAVGCAHRGMDLAREVPKSPSGVLPRDGDKRNDSVRRNGKRHSGPANEMGSEGHFVSEWSYAASGPSIYWGCAAKRKRKRVFFRASLGKAFAPSPPPYYDCSGDGGNPFNNSMGLKRYKPPIWSRQFFFGKILDHHLQPRLKTSIIERKTGGGPSFKPPPSFHHALFYR